MTMAKTRSVYGRAGARLPQMGPLPIQWALFLLAVVLLVPTTCAVVVGQELFPLCEVCGCFACPPGFRVTKGDAVYPIPVELQELANGNTEVRTYATSTQIQLRDGVQDKENCTSSSPSKNWYLNHHHNSHVSCVRYVFQATCNMIETAGLMLFIPPEVCSDEIRLDDDFRRICGCPPVPTAPMTPAPATVSMPVPIPSKPVSRPATTPVTDDDDDDDDDKSSDDATTGKAFRPPRHDNKKHKRTNGTGKGARGKGVAKPKEKSPQPPAAAPATTSSSVSKCKQVTLLLNNVEAFITRLNQRIEDTGLLSVKLVVVSVSEESSKTNLFCFCLYFM
jgi:hypothetical protein